MDGRIHCDLSCCAGWYAHTRPHLGFRVSGLGFRYYIYKLSNFTLTSYIYTYTHIYTYVHMYTYIHTYIYIYIFIHRYTCIYIYIHIYIYTVMLLSQLLYIHIYIVTLHSYLLYFLILNLLNPKR
jgi:hypothetical protein